MTFSMATCAALLLLFTAASCAPTAGTRLQGACQDVRNSSLELNRIAHTFSALTRPKEEIHFSNSLVWMEAKDMCDPGSLKHKSATCIGKILSVLTSYYAYVERVAGYKSCSEFASKVKPVIKKLQKDMSTCLMSKGGMGHVQVSNVSAEVIETTTRWQGIPRCHYTMDRLFSFSIFTARVFAVGDPANHGDSKLKCT